MGLPDRRRLPDRKAPGPLDSKWGHVRGPITVADELRIKRDNQQAWRGPLMAAIRWYMAHPVPDSVVHPKWVPVGWLADTFCGVDGLDLDGLVATIIQLTRDGRLIERTIRIGNVNWPVVTTDTAFYIPLADLHYRPIEGGVRLPGGATMILDGMTRPALGSG
jgi:hypothetical protein